MALEDIVRRYGGSSGGGSVRRVDGGTDVAVDRIVKRYSGSAPRERVQQPQRVSIPSPKKISQPKRTYASNVPKWLRGLDIGLSKFSKGAENFPKFTFADKYAEKNPGRPVRSFGRSILQDISNIPSRAVSNVLSGYGEDLTVKRLAGGAETGLDIASLFAGGGAAKSLVKQGIKQPLKQVLKEGAKRGVKYGAGYGSAYGAVGGLKDGDNLGEILKKSAIGGAAGAAFGGGIGVGSPLIGKMWPKMKKTSQVPADNVPETGLKTVGALKTTGETKAKVKATPTGIIQGQQDIFGNKLSDKNVDIKFRGVEKSKIPVRVKKSLVDELGDSIQPEKLTDISALGSGMTDVYRVFEKVFGKKFPMVKAAILDPFDSAKGNRISEINARKGKLYNIVEKLGIKKGSKMSAAVQQYGEKRIGYRQLVEKFGKKKAGDIAHANNWFRREYNQLLDEVNASRAKIYPGQKDKLIPKREDYYRHFRELNSGISGLKNLFDSPAGIPAELAGISQYTKPKSKWLSFAQKRLTNKTDDDAVGGFLNYLDSAMYAKHIDPHTAIFRKFERKLVKQLTGTEYNGKLNNFQSFLTMFADDLAGSTNPLDKGIQKFTGRKVFGILDWTNKRVKANVILGNMYSSVAQIFNVPQGMSNAGMKSSKRGLSRTLASIFAENTPMKKSNFIKERYFKGYGEFDSGMLSSTKKFASWMITALDEAGTKFIWNAHYEKAIAGGIPNPIKYADDMARKMVAGRGVGEVPILQKSKVFQMVAPFQLEVTNVWHVMNDWAGKKAAGKFAQFFVYSYLFNRAAEQIRGNGVSFDPIEAMIDSYGTLTDPDEEQKLLKAGGRLAGEVFSNIPGGQTLASIYPEYGTEKLPTRKELFGKEDPTRFGGGALFTKGLQDPFYKLLPPFGGQQLKRTAEGLGAFGRGYSKSRNDQVRYPIEQSGRNLLQSGAFGQYSTPEGRDYFNENRRVLGEEQSLLFKGSSGDARKSFYENTIQERAIKKENEKLKKKTNPYYK